MGTRKTASGREIKFRAAGGKGVANVDLPALEWSQVTAANRNLKLATLPSMGTKLAKFRLKGRVRLQAYPRALSAAACRCFYLFRFGTGKNGIQHARFRFIAAVDRCFPLLAVSSRNGQKVAFRHASPLVKPPPSKRSDLRFSSRVRCR